MPKISLSDGIIVELIKDKVIEKRADFEPLFIDSGNIIKCALRNKVAGSYSWNVILETLQNG
jgi:hypothetical protein